MFNPGTNKILTDGNTDTNSTLYIRIKKSKVFHPQILSLFSLLSSPHRKNTIRHVSMLEKLKIGTWYIYNKYKIGRIINYVI